MSATLLYRYPLLTGHASRFPRRRSLPKLANSLGMKGWVRNLDDGSVEVYAIGSRAEHDELSGHLRKGPNMSDIRSMELQRPRRRS